MKGMEAMVRNDTGMATEVMVRNIAAMVMEEVTEVGIE
jgi:hypothetical protein